MLKVVLSTENEDQDKSDQFSVQAVDENFNDLLKTLLHGEEL